MDAVTSPLRWFLRVAAVLALLAGLLLFVGATETDRFFSWTIEPPLTAAFLGAAYWAAFVLLAWAAMQRSWLRVRAALVPVFAIAVLLLIATIVHIDRFDLDSLFGWFWLVVYALVIPFLVAALALQLRDASPAPAAHDPLPAWLRAALSLQAAVMLVVGAALFVAPSDAAELWPWPLTPLTARAVGAFLVGFGLAAAFAVRENSFERLRGAALAYAALGALELLAVAIHAGDLDSGAGGVFGYVIVWASVLGVALYGVVRSRSAATAASGSR